MKKKASFLALLFMAGCTSGKAVSAPEEKAQGPLVVQTIKAEDLKAREYIEVTGLLFPAQEVTVMAGVPGEVAKIEANEGDFVRKGEPLAILDQREFRIAVRQAEHQVEAARLAVKQLETDYARQKALHESGSVTASQLEQITLQLDLARNQLRLAQDGLEMARKKLEDTVIRAPFDCYLTNRLVSVGSRITAMPPTVMFKVIDLANLEFKMQVPDVHSKHVKKGNRVAVWFGSIGREVVGVVDEVVSSIDPRSMTFTAIVKINNKSLDYALKPGLMGNAKIFSDELANTFLVEKKVFKSLDLETGRGTVFVLEGGKANPREIIVEPVDDLRVRVVGGLKDEDLIIASAISVLSDGQEVSVTR